MGSEARVANVLLRCRSSVLYLSSTKGRILAGDYFGRAAFVARARETIIQLYEKATGKTFTEKDQECLTEYMHYGVDCLTLAILMGRARCRGTINAFRYFEGNIREVAAWQPDKIERELAVPMGAVPPASTGVNLDAAQRRTVAGLPAG